MIEPFVHSIACSGKAIHQAFARLKPSYPKGSRAERVEVLLWATEEGVRMGLPGGEVSVEAESRGVPFAVAIKFKLFRDLVREEFGSRDSVTLEFDDGRLRFGGVTLSGVPVRLGRPDDIGPAVPVARSESEESVRRKPVSDQSIKTIERPVESLLNEPMGRIYCHIKFSPPGTTPASVELLRLYQEAERRVERAAKTLAPLGLSKDDLEQLLRSRFGGKR